MEKIEATHDMRAPTPVLLSVSVTTFEEEVNYSIIEWALEGLVGQVMSRMREKSLGVSNG